MRCDLKTLGECACTTQCAVQTITPAPAILPSWRTQFIVVLFLGFLMTFGSAAVLELRMAGKDTNCQEACVSWKR